MIYKITMTSADGLSCDKLSGLRSYFKNHCVNAYLINEHGETGGNSHVEGLAQFETATTSNVTKRVKCLYLDLGLEVSPFSIIVKKCTHLNGALIYARKELEKMGTVLLLKGWKQTWIDQKVKESVKDIPYRLLKKKGIRLTQRTAAGLMHEWCKAHNMIVIDRESMLRVVSLMAVEGFLFGNLQRPKGVYVDLCALFGSGKQTASLFDFALIYLN